MYQIYTLIGNDWHTGYKYNDLDCAKWHIDRCVVNPMACVVDITTGEIVYGL